MTRLAARVVAAALGSTAAMVVNGCSAPRRSLPPTPGPAAPSPTVVLAPEGCHADDLQGLWRCLEPDRSHADLRRLAQPRPPGSEGHRMARARCRTALADLGYEVRLQLYDGGTNVVARREGFKTPEHLVTLGAHYDHLPGCAGADDNATGVAALLEVARVAARARFERTVEFVCWDGGEAGQTGSAAYAAEVDRRGFRGAVVLESIGYASDEEDTQEIPKRFDEVFPDQSLALLDRGFRADFLTVVADGPTEGWAKSFLRDAEDDLAFPGLLLVVSAAVKAKAKKDELYRSDHMSFWDADLPAVLLTDTGGFRHPGHHCPEQGPSDDITRIDFAFFDKATATALAALVRGAKLRPALGTIR
ncbi:MAG: M28 family peptidase [Myxococcota bacterium]